MRKKGPDRGAVRALAVRRRSAGKAGDELPGHPGGAAGVADLPLHGTGVEKLPVHLHLVQTGQVVDEGQILPLVHGHIGDAQAEALGQSGLFRDGLKGVDLLARPL